MYSRFQVTVAMVFPGDAALITAMKVSTGFCFCCYQVTEHTTKPIIFAEYLIKEPLVDYFFSSLVIMQRHYFCAINLHQLRQLILRCSLVGQLVR